MQIGYGLTRAAMRQWGLYISKGELAEEPPYFNEPGLFLIKPDGILFFVGVNNAPYGRPSLDTLLAGVKQCYRMEIFFSETVRVVIYPML